VFESVAHVQKRFDQGIRDGCVNGVKVTVVVDSNKTLVRSQSRKVVSHDIMSKIILEEN
jgi:hypothetical protein